MAVPARTELHHEKRENGIAGGYARAKGLRLAKQVLIALVGVVTVTAIGGVIMGWRPPSFLVLEAAAIVAMWVGGSAALRAIDHWLRGADGERQVGEILDGLSGSGWFVAHDISTGRGNIDHCALGPGGVFAIETKSHGGTRRVGSVSKGMLRQAYAEAKALERVSGEHATPLLVFSRAWLDEPVSSRRGVVILPARLLAGYLQRRPLKLSPHQIEAARQTLLQGSRAP